MENFISSTFTEAGKWRSLSLHELDKLLVDAHGICQQLYLSHHSWELGGEYRDFYTATREFFGELLSTGVQLIVVFHGSQPHDQGKLDLTRKLKTDTNKRMWRIQRQIVKKWHPIGTNIVPLLVWSVFADVVRNLGISYHIAGGSGGDARREISALANHYQCPVLAASSDYFMFELDHGYLPFDTLSTIIASGLLYHTDEFQSLFHLKTSILRLLVPAIHGNDFLQCTTAIGHSCDFKITLESIAAYDDCEAYLVDEAKDTVRENFQIAKKIFCDVHFPPNHDLVTSLCDDLPAWIAIKFREGFLDLELLNVFKNNTNVLQNVVEDVNKESAWLASRHIRQLCYGLMGLLKDTKVKECIRAKASPEVTETLVSPEYFEPARNVKDLTDVTDKKVLQKLVLGVLKLNDGKLSDIDREFSMIDEQLKLPIAAAYYWYHTCDSPPVQRHLVKSLLLSFLTCSGVVGFDERRSVLEPVTRNTKEDHFSSLHAFAQWQCVYHDVMSLNCLVNEPFVTTSPAMLFSGKVAMYYASFVRRSRSPDEVLLRDSEAWIMYNRCLFMVTGCDVEGRKAKAKLNPPSPKPPVTLSLSNRYDVLSISQD